MRDAPLGEFLHLASDPVTLEDDLAYETAGILSYGKGLFRRPVVLGRDTSYVRYFRIRANQFVYSRLFAWEGALTVVPIEFDGLFVSQEFPVFEIHRDVAVPDYVALLTRWPEFWERLRGTETGMGGRRKRVHPSALLGVRVPLPPLAQQRRIVDLVTAIDDMLSRTARLVDAAMGAYFSLLEDSFGAINASAQPLCDLAETRLGKMLDAKRSSRGDQFPYLRNVNVQWDEIRLGDLKRMSFDDRERGELALYAGDVLVCEGGEVGRTAVVSSDLPGIYFQKAVHRVRCGPTLRPRFFLHFMRWAARSGALADYSTSLTIAHLTGEKLQVIPVPMPEIADQDAVSRRLDVTLELAQTASSQLAAGGSARQTVMNALLKGTAAIPPSYDRFLDGAA